MKRSEAKKYAAKAAAAMDGQWFAITAESNAGTDDTVIWEMKVNYFGMARMLESLGGNWERDCNGKHRVWAFGTSAMGSDLV